MKADLEMTRKHFFVIFVVSLLVRGGVGWLQKSPGFMDAEYYYVGGLALAQGKGFTEEILWNYLDDPVGLPHPSHGYWMPLTSIFAAIGMVITQNLNFRGAQAILILVSSIMPPLTAHLNFQLTNKRASALLAGGLAIFAAFYFTYMSTSDTFGGYATLGAIFFTLLSMSFRRNFVMPILLGVIAGLMHLSRADGILWLGFAWLGANFAPSQKLGKINFSGIAKNSFWVMGGYLMIMGPWFLRNLNVFGSPLAPGGSRSFWITSYNELFIYPGAQLTMERWLSTGLKSILEARTWALGINLQRSLVEQGMIFLTPLILLGFWHERRDFRIRLASFIWVCTFLAMTIVFPYQGARGGFFHSSAALLPILWAAAPIGLDHILQWVGHRRGWNLREAGMIFSAATLIFAIMLSFYNVTIKLVGKHSQWEENARAYPLLEEVITDFGARPGSIAMMINPPGYFAHTQRPSIAIPDGDVQTTLEVAKRYQGRFLLVEKGHPEGLNELYDNPQAFYPGLQYLTSIDDTHIFLIK